MPYALQVHLQEHPETRKRILAFHNGGDAGAVLHVCDKLHLGRIARRYTIESGKTMGG